MQSNVKRIAPGTAPEGIKALNRLSREQMKLRLLADIRLDLEICELEGWDKLEYLRELRAIVNSFFRKKHVDEND